MWKLFHLVLGYFAFICVTSAQNCPTSQCDCFMENGLKKINCRYKTLTQIPAFTANGEVYDAILFSSTEGTADCTASDCNKITSISADAFANLRVKSIDLHGNAITQFDNNAFRGLESDLHELFIEGNGVVLPPYSSIANLPNLQSLHFKNFRQQMMTNANTNLNLAQLQKLILDQIVDLTNIEAAAFDNLPAVTEFHLIDLPTLTQIPVASVLKLQQLEILIIQNTGIQRVYGGSFASLNNIHSIHLDRNDNLVTIDNTAFYGVTDTLEFLYMNQNKLTSSVFNMFKSFNWAALTQLHIGYNNFVTIPAGSFQTMPNLIYLEIQDIGLEAIDNTMFTGLSKLHTLDIGYNKIDSVAQGTFENSPDLKELRINEQITNKQLLFADQAFRGIENSLERLLIERNTINAATFWTLVGQFTNLLDLEAGTMGLDSIPDRAFMNNQKLTKLVLSNNNITSINQATFYGPRDTLTSVSLNDNLINTIDKCVFSDFQTVPNIFMGGNAITCDCQMVWFHDWVNSQSDPTQAAITSGVQCSSPPNLANQYFFQFTRDSLLATCPPGYVEPTCPDLYFTTTTTITTTTIVITNTTPPSTTTRPKPIFGLYVGRKTETSISLTWTVSDKTDVTGYVLEMSPSNAPKQKVNIHKDETDYTFYQLQQGNSYYFCLILELNNVEDNDRVQCQTASPSGGTEAPSTTAATTPEPEAQTQVGVIVGVSVGAVVLIVLIVVIVCLLLKSQKKKKQRTPMTEGIKFTHHANMPHAGGTAKRFAKKADQEGTSEDDINITVISGNDTNKDRMSAGSYQYFNQKAVNANPGAYANDFDTRPLPNAPGGASGYGQPNGGYVNQSFKNSANHLPETSANNYSEIRY